MTTADIKKSDKNPRPISAHTPLFRASVASAPGTFLSSAWLTAPSENDESELRCYSSGSNTLNINLRSSLSTINSEGVKEKDVSPERSSVTNNHNNDNIKDKKRTDKTDPTTANNTTTDQASSTYYDSSVKSWPIKRSKNRDPNSDVTGSQWRSLENLSRALLLVAFVSFSVGIGLTTAGFATNGLPVNTRVSLQIAGPVMLAGAVVASSLGYFLGKLWKGEWKQRQLEMESAVRNKIEKMAKELQEQIYQHHQRDYITYEYPQRSQKWLPKLSPSCSKIVEGVLHEIGSNLEDKAATRLSENFSTETTTANSRRSSSRLNSLAEISWRARDSVSSVLLKQEIENQLQGLQSSPNQIPGIQISRIETIDLDRASAGSSGSSMKRFIIVHGDLTSSQFSFTSEYSLLSSNARSRSSNEASLLEFSPRESEWDADVSLCSRDSQTSIAYSRSSRGSGREVGRIFYHQYLQQQPQQQQQQSLLIPPSHDRYVGKYSNILTSPRRHSSPLSSQNRKNNSEGKSGRFTDRYFDRVYSSRPLADNTDSESSLNSRHPCNPPYSSCSPLLLKINSNNQSNNITKENLNNNSNNKNHINNNNNNMSSSNINKSINNESKPESTNQQLYSYHKQLLQQQSQQCLFNDRMKPWFRKRSDQSIISMKINEHEDDDDDENDVNKNIKKPEIVNSLEDNLTTEENSIEKEKNAENNCTELRDDDCSAAGKQRINASVTTSTTIDPTFLEGKPQQPRDDLQQQQSAQHKRKKKSSSSPPRDHSFQNDGSSAVAQKQLDNLNENENEDGDRAATAVTTSASRRESSGIYLVPSPRNARTMICKMNTTSTDMENANDNNDAEDDDEDNESSIADLNNIDPRWRHFFGGSCSMALVASSTVASVLERRRTSLKRNNTDDSEVERRVARLLKEIEMSATDSLEDQQQTMSFYQLNREEPEKDYNFKFAQKQINRKHKRKHCRPLVNVPVASKSVGTEPSEKCPVRSISHDSDKPSEGDLESLASRTKQRRNSYAATGIIRRQAIFSSSSSSQPTSQLISSSSFSSRTNRSAETQTFAFDSFDWKRPPTKFLSFARRDVGTSGQETSALTSEMKGRDNYGSFKENLKRLSPSDNDRNIENIAVQSAASQGRQASPATSLAAAHLDTSSTSSLTRNANKLKLIARSVPQVLVAECSKLVARRGANGGSGKDKCKL